MKAAGARGVVDTVATLRTVSPRLQLHAAATYAARTPLSSLKEQTEAEEAARGHVTLSSSVPALEGIVTIALSSAWRKRVREGCVAPDRDSIRALRRACPTIFGGRRHSKQSEAGGETSPTTGTHDT